MTSRRRNDAASRHRRCRVTVLVVGAIASIAAGCGGDGNPLPLVGTLERDRIELVAEAAEPIVAVDVKEGDHVASGAVLLRQDTASSAARIAQADAVVDEARHRLTELTNGERVETVDEARARLGAASAGARRDEAELRRVEELVARRLVSASDLDTARAARDSSAATRREAQAVLTAYVRGTRAEDLDQARAALAAAEAARRELDVSDSRLVVRATRDGTIESLPYELGERPPQGAPVVVMLADTAAYARVFVPESLRASVRAGDAATIHADGMTEPLPGKVRFIASEATFTPYYALTQRDRSRLAYLAEVEVTSSGASALPAGVPVEVEFPGRAGR